MQIRGALLTALSVALVALVAPPATAASPDLVRDAMERNVSAGWGSAEIGGAWQAVSGATSVSSGVARLASPAPGRTAIVRLNNVKTADTQSSFALLVPALPTSGSLYLSHAVRVGEMGSYAVRVVVRSDGTAFLGVVRLRNLVTAQILDERPLSMKIKPGSKITVSFEVSGSDSVSLKAKAWASSSAQPAGWQIQAADSSSTRVLKAGGLAFTLFTSSSATKATPVALDDLLVRPAAVAKPDPLPDPPTPPQSGPDSGAHSAAVRGGSGATAPGGLSYPAPANAIYVSPTGSNAANGTKASPLRTVTEALKAVPNGGTIVLRGGRYHEFVLIPPQKRVTVQPAAGEAVWFDGAEPVTGWRQSGATWIKDNWTLKLDASPTYKRGAPDNAEEGWRFVSKERPMAAHPDQLWVGGSQLTEVESRDRVKDGTFFVDDAAKQLVIGSNPTGKSVEASTLTQALSIRSAGSHIRGIGVRRYATSLPDMGTVVVAANDVTLTDMTVRDNSTTGIYSWSLRTTLTRVSLINNGLLGGGASTADGLRASQLLSAGNNAEGFNRAPVSGAFKVTRSRNVSIIDSAFVNNPGQGPWFDESVHGITFTGNDVIGNSGNGLVVELSEKVVVADNIVADNGRAGIAIINTGNVNVWNNTVVRQDRNVAITMDARRASNLSAAGHDPRQPKPDPTVPWITRNIVVSNNVLTSPSGNCMVCIEDYSRSLTGAQMVTATNGNLYQRPSSDAPKWFGVWSRGAVKNPAVSNSLRDFTAETGQEGRSSLIEGASPLTADFRLLSPHASRQSQIALPVPNSVAQVSKLSVDSSVLGASFE